VFCPSFLCHSVENDPALRLRRQRNSKTILLFKLHIVLFVMPSTASAVATILAFGRPTMQCGLIRCDVREPYASDQAFALLSRTRCSGSLQQARPSSLFSSTLTAALIMQIISCAYRLFQSISVLPHAPAIIVIERCRS
jgi:hypothetical protein